MNIINNKLIIAIYTLYTYKLKQTKITCGYIHLMFNGWQ